MPLQRSLMLPVLLLVALMAPMPGAAGQDVTETEAALSDAALERLLAPVALYPDTLLTQILVAATYPLEVVEAARFVRANPQLEGVAAITAAAEFDWDPSVQALLAFPEILERMDDDLNWTQTVGEAFLVQEEALMAAVQTLRQRARLAGTLDAPEHLRLDQDGDQIRLSPTRDDLVYVPWYDTRQAYGEWPSSRYHPVYWEPVAWHHSSRMARSSFLWGPGIHFDPRFYPTRLDWHRRGVIVIHHGAPAGRWQHDPKHRRGARYRHPDADRRYADRDRGGARRSHRDRDRYEQRHQDRPVSDRRDQRQPTPGTWPESPTASLSQQRAGAIDTRTASERLRAMQAEAAAASARSGSERRGPRQSVRSDHGAAASGAGPGQHATPGAARSASERGASTQRDIRSTPRQPGRAGAASRAGSRASTPHNTGPASPVMRPANAPPEVRTSPRTSPSSAQGVRSSRSEAGARSPATRQTAPRPGMPPRHPD